MPEFRFVRMGYQLSFGALFLGSKSDLQLRPSTQLDLKKLGIDYVGIRCVLAHR